jgi:DNA-binding GntR family transcriptional regulator
MPNDLNLSALTRSPTLAARAYDQVKEAIITGALAPGSQTSESELARTLSISRAPLREALGRLGEEGFIASASVGVCVSPLTQRDVSDIYDVRLVLEGHAAGLAFNHVPSSELAAMRAATLALEADLSAGNPEPFIALDIEFHDLWVRNCGNSLVQDYVRRLRDHIRRASYLARGLTQASREAYMEHLGILDAFANGSRRDFREAVENHILHTGERMLEAFPSGASAAAEATADDLKPSTADA